MRVSLGSSEQRYETHHNISSMFMFFDEIFLITASRFEPLRAFMPMGYILFVLPNAQICSFEPPRPVWTRHGSTSRRLHPVLRSFHRRRHLGSIRDKRHTVFWKPVTSPVRSLGSVSVDPTENEPQPNRSWGHCTKVTLLSGRREHCRNIFLGREASGYDRRSSPKKQVKIIPENWEARNR